jgi:hypothetical protein
VTELPPAGWYRDPDGNAGGLRYWDGSIWTEHRSASTPPLHEITQEVLPEPQSQQGSSWEMFRTDLKWSAHELRRSPLLLLITVAIFALIDLGLRRDVQPTGVTVPLSLAAEVYLVGFVGAQRVWFLRKLRGVPFHAREMWTLPWKFFGRFLCLDLLGTAIALPVFIPLIFVTLPPAGTPSANPTPIPTVFRIVLLVGSLLFDVMLTFVVPALALNVRSARASIRLGWTMTKRTWPANAWYMFTPGITLVALTALLPASTIPTGLDVCIGIASGALGLWFKGATVAFYVRSVPAASVDGSADV